MSFSSATVIATTRLSDRFRRVTLLVDDAAALALPRAGDCAVGVYFGFDASGPGRNYSVRNQVARPEGDLIDLDIVDHGAGPGVQWARTAVPGDRVGLDHARCWYAPASSTDWQILVADLAGLPPLARIIEELPTGVPVTVLVEVLTDTDLDYLPDRTDVRVLSSVGTGNGVAPSRLAEMVRETHQPPGRGYCWFAGEAAQSRAVRKHLRAGGWTLDQFDISGYWRFGSEDWDAKFARVQDELVAVYERALAAGKGDKAASEEFDDALERAGL
jgi:NADPH-dependent ferric siderophore reductase